MCLLPSRAPEFHLCRVFHLVPALPAPPALTFSRHQPPTVLCDFLSREVHINRDGYSVKKKRSQKYAAVGNRGRTMNNINSAERQARRLVDNLFNGNAARRGQRCDWPIVGGHYVSGEDPTKAMRELAVCALLAREGFARNGPPDAQPLPLSYDQREDMKGRGLLYYILALYARSLGGRRYNLEEHPPFFPTTLVVCCGKPNVLTVKSVRFPITPS